MARWFLLSSLARFGLLLTVAGCGSDVEIRSYSVPIERQQMLAAIVRQGNEAWFFKLKEPASEVAQLRKPVREFLSSIRFSNGEPQWTLPQNWVQEGERSEMRFATLRVSGGESPL